MLFGNILGGVYAIFLSKFIKLTLPICYGFFVIYGDPCLLICRKASQGIHENR